MKSARRRFERHLHKIVGAWLAGPFDRDRVVARAASDGLASFLSTPEKVTAFWNKCQSQILDYAIEAIQETPDTLSDERSTTKEDAETKYFRVVTASLSLVLGLLQRIEPSNLEKQQEHYDEYFAEDNIWKAITFNDATVRKTVCQLLFASIDRKLPYAGSSKVKQAIITGGLKTNHLGSALEYVRALTKMTQVYPDVWNSSKPPADPKSPLSRLQAFIAKGSQGSRSRFWEYLDQLLSILPAHLITPEVASRFMTSLKAGITNRDEPRTNTSLAWKCFIDTAKRLLTSLPETDQLAFVEGHLFPLLEQFLFSVSEKTAAIPLGPNAISILVEAYISIVQAAPNVVAASLEEWDRLGRVLGPKMYASLPEVSRDFHQSQEKVAEEGRRWFSVVGQIEEKLSNTPELPDHTLVPSAALINKCVALLESRNLKPYGMARVLEFALSTAPAAFAGEAAKEVSAFLLKLSKEDAAKAVASPSSRYLLSCIHLIGAISDDFVPIWASWTKAILALPPSTARDSALASLISRDTGSSLARKDEEMQGHLVAQSISVIKGETESWEVFEAVITYQSLTEESCRKLLQQLVRILEEEPEHTENALTALETIAKDRPDLFSQDEETHLALVAQLLGLSEIENASVSSKATAIRSLLDNHVDGKLPVINIIQSNLERAGPQSLG